MLNKCGLPMYGTELFSNKIQGASSSSTAPRENYSQSDAEGTSTTFVGFIHVFGKFTWPMSNKCSLPMYGSNNIT